MDKLIEDLNLAKINNEYDLIKVSLSPKHCRILTTQPIDEFYCASENLSNNLGSFNFIS
jgi:hypothetical protein